jgi:hypothetical protein
MRMQGQECQQGNRRRRRGNTRGRPTPGAAVQSPGSSLERGLTNPPHHLGGNVGRRRPRQVGNQRTHACKASSLLGKLRICRQRCFDRSPLCGVKLAIEVRTEQRFVVCSHGFHAGK